MGVLASCCFEFSDKTAPRWGGDVLCCGGDKCIYQGKFDGKRVAVCVSKGIGGHTRIDNEIAAFKTIDKHPYIIDMYYHGVHRGDRILALEIVEPIGFDLDRLKNQYQFARQSVPVSLMGRIVGQLAEALKHMHGLKLLHRDLKTENVLIDTNYQTKLIDMGICVKFGARDALFAPYMAPELCAGLAQGAEVDCWGIGLILHQVYQHRWQLLSRKANGIILMIPNMPSTKYDMEPNVRQAMDGLLAFSKKDRWTMDTLTGCQWLQAPQSPQETTSGTWHKLMGKSIDKRRSLQLFQSSHPMPTALAVTITEGNHAHLISKPLGELELGKKLGVTVLLIKRDSGKFETIPGSQTRIDRGDWIYFGVPQGHEFNDAVDGLQALLHGSDCEVITESSQLEVSRFRSLSKKEVVATGKLVEFAVEFDCFSFPQHIGQQVEIGPNGLNLRSRFGINLVGIVRHNHKGQHEEEWFPGGTAIVHPGDLGLVMRAPSADGSSQPTHTDAELSPLMKEKLFQKA